MFIIMKTQEFVDVRVGESTQPDHGYELSDKCIITKSSNAVASGAGSRVDGMLILEQEAKACFRIKVLS